MADSSIPISGGVGYNVDTRTTTNGDHREVVVIGDATTDNVAKVGPGGDRVSSLTSPEMALFGISAKVSPDSKLWTTTDPNTVFTEPFDTGTLDTQRWTQSGTVAPAFLSGTLAISPGTANSASTVLSSVPTFQPNGIGFEMFGTVITLEPAKIAGPNSHRFWGVGQVSSYSSATPLTDGAGYEIGIDGELNCVCYVGGTKYVVNSTLAANISSSVAGMGGSGTAAPTGAGLTNFGAVLAWPGNTKRYFMQYRPDSVIWYIDSLTKPVASATYVNPNVSGLPVRLAAITTPAGTVSSGATFNVAGCAVSDSTKQNQLLSDPVYPWRKAGVGKNGGLSIKGSAITGVSTAVPATTTSTIGPVDVSEAGNVTFTIKSTAPAVPYTGNPVIVFEQSDDATSWAPLQTVRGDTGSLGSTITLTPGTANASLTFDASLGGVNWVRARLTTGTTANGITIVVQPGGLALNSWVSVINPGDVRNLSQPLVLTSGNTVATGALNGQGQVALQVTGTWTGVLTFESSIDGTTYVPVNAVQIGSTNQFSSTTTFNGAWHIAVSGFQQMRVRCTTTGTGTAIVSLSASAAPTALDQVGLWRPDSVTRVAVDPTTVLTETFETLNTTDVWTLGGTVPTVSSGQASFAPGTAALAQSYMRSQAAFSLNAGAFENATMVVQVEAATLTGNKAWWGLGIPNTTPTVAVPVLNGVVFEILDTDGQMYGAVYSGGTRVQSVPLVRPTDGGQHRYAIYNKTSRVYFEIDNINVGSIGLPNTQVASLPVTIGSVNGASVLGTARALFATLLGLGDTGRNANQIADGTFAWRKAQVGKNGGVSVKGSAIAGLSTPFAATATGTAGPVDVSEAGNVTIAVKSTIPASPYTGAPVLVFEQSDDATSWAAMAVVRSDTQSSLSTHVLPAGVANGELMFNAPMLGTMYVRVRVTTAAATNGMTIAILPGGMPFQPMVTSVASAPASVTSNGPTSVTAAAADTLLLAANAARRGMSLFNDSTAVLYLALGTNAATLTAFTLKIPAGGYYELPFYYSGMVRGIWAAANGSARITEIVMP